MAIPDVRSTESSEAVYVLAGVSVNGSASKTQLK